MNATNSGLCELYFFLLVQGVLPCSTFAFVILIHETWAMQQKFPRIKYEKQCTQNVQCKIQNVKWKLAYDVMWSTNSQGYNFILEHTHRVTPRCKLPQKCNHFLVNKIRNMINRFSKWDLRFHFFKFHLNTFQLCTKEPQRSESKRNRNDIRKYFRTLITETRFARIFSGSPQRKSE